LKRLSKVVDLNDSKVVEEFILGLECSNKSKTNFMIAYNHYCLANEIAWHRINLRKEVYPVKVPTEARINMIISSSTQRFAVIFNISK
jgi:hypothetical protein